MYFIDVVVCVLIDVSAEPVYPTAKVRHYDQTEVQVLWECVRQRKKIFALDVKLLSH